MKNKITSLTLKTIFGYAFILTSVILLCTLIGSLSFFLVTNPKLTYIDYMFSYGKFLIFATFYIGGVFVIIFLMQKVFFKIWDKFFSQKKN